LRLLIIDDDKPVLRLLGRHLSAHETVMLDSGLAAIKLLRDDHAFDVIVCDVQLGDCSGIQVHAEVEAIDSDLADRVIFVTGGALANASQDFLDEQGRFVIYKPFRSDELHRLVGEASGTAMEMRDRSS